jgi:hypothetical protein
MELLGFGGKGEGLGGRLGRSRRESVLGRPTRLTTHNSCWIPSLRSRLAFASRDGNFERSDIAESGLAIVL